MSPYVSFKNVTTDYLKDCFLKAHIAFDSLHYNPIYLQQLALPDYTMRAQPVLNWHFWKPKRRHYRIQMSNHLKIAQYIQLDELPPKVLIGWFAHELGHLMDYHRRSVWSLFGFILGYVAFPTHRIGAERRADLYALEKGFGEELMATKLYILEQSTLPDRYKDRIRKYYLSPAELEDILREKPPTRRHF